MSSPKKGINFGIVPLKIIELYTLLYWPHFDELTLSSTTKQALVAQFTKI